MVRGISLRGPVTALKKVDDLGLRKAIQKAYQFEELPRAPVIRNLAEPWRPYRTVTTLYLWKSLEGPEGGQI